MTTIPLVNVAGAQITRESNGSIVVDDPGSPLLLRVRTDNAVEPVRIVELVVTVRHPTARINPSGLARLPLAQIRHLAAAADHPNDSIWQMGISPKLPGGRSWPPEHWVQVLAVNDWAVTTNRPGGGPQAVADMWHVARNPTAYRWLKLAETATGRKALRPNRRVAASSAQTRTRR